MQIDTKETRVEGQSEKSPDQSSSSFRKIANSVVHGTVTFKGMGHTRKSIDTSADPKCAGMLKDRPLHAETLIVSDKGGIKNTLIFVTKGLEAFRFPTPEEPFVLRTERCRFAPHVFGIMVDQKLRIMNIDSTLHNPHLIPSRNAHFGRSQSQPAERSFSWPEIIPIKCDVHPWMGGYCGVFANPIFTVSNFDGSFELPSLPAGNYTIEAWHEHRRLKSQQFEITLKENERKKLEIIFHK